MGNRPLTLLNLISGNGRGGSDRLALDVSKGLALLGHRVIWGSPSDCELNEEAFAAGLEHFDPYSRNSEQISGPRSFMRFCKEEGVDIVNSHHSKDRHLLFAARLRGLTSKIVFTRHCILSGIPLIGTFYYNLVDLNIAVSNAVKESLLRGGVWQKKVAMIYGGVNIEKFSNPPRDEVLRIRHKYCREGMFTIGMVGRYCGGKDFRPGNPSMKGHEFLFRALSALGGNFQVLLLGVWGDDDMGNLAKVAEYCGLSADRLTFCDFQKEIAPFYKIMDLNVLPSKNEGLGLALIEAMAAGVPCIGADSGGIREIISDELNGLLFMHGDSRALAEKIRIMRDDGTRRELFVSNAKETVKRFDIRRTVEETERVFYGLMKESKAVKRRKDPFAC
jgi:glycosyltransferase involved in cell wall biosynthesis